MIILVGNKVDRETDREVEKAVAEEYAEKQGIQYVEISAKTAKGVH